MFLLKWRIYIAELKIFPFVKMLLNLRVPAAVTFSKYIDKVNNSAKLNEENENITVVSELDKVQDKIHTLS